MANTSATGGYLQPTNVVIDDQALKRFLHDVIVGITGLDNTLVRPGFQANPPTRPNIDVNWCGFSIINKRTESLPLYRQDDEESGTQSTNELFDLLVSFYGPNCTAYAGVLRDGLQITQNLEQLFAAGMAPLGTDGIIYTADLVNDRFYERADITINMNRDVSRTYDILSLLSVEGTILGSNEYEENFEVTT